MKWCSRNHNTKWKEWSSRTEIKVQSAIKNYDTKKHNTALIPTKKNKRNTSQPTDNRSKLKGAKSSKEIKDVFK